jgi:serine/threonine protein kinase
MVTVVPSPSPSLNTLTPGRFFRHYQLLEQVGVGGQAVVWSAVDESHRRIYAIKFNKVLDSDEIRAEEIGIEQKLDRLVSLTHPHILPLLEYGSEERIRFTVSPYIPGGTLAARIKSGSLSTDEVLRYGSEVASALDYLHSRGVIHRDLKTTNILMDLSKHTYLADFGLARLISTSTLAFHTGHGTPPYAPPEQILSQEITLKSDIFSFGILLFEMFTGQLPWRGQKQLGVEQLHSDKQLPDPRELVPDLPPLLSDVLCRVTAANPEMRPRSAGEAMKMVAYVFRTPVESLEGDATYDEELARDRDAEQLLQQGLARWKAADGNFHLGLTPFALIDLQRRKHASDEINPFMLSQALTYGYQDEYWWSVVADARERFAVASTLLRKENEVIAARILEHLTGERDHEHVARGLPESIVKSLMTIGTRTSDEVFRQRIFGGLRRLLRRRNTWQDPPLDPEQLRRLGLLALEDSPAGDTTAELIGHLRAPSAVRVILSHPDENRKIAALLRVQKAAGNLPAFVPGQIRSQLSFEWFWRRLTNQPVRLIGAYILAFLGASLGIGLQVYLTFILPEFFDIARIATSVEQGLILGSVLGLGVFLARALTERSQPLHSALRVLLGSVAGAVLVNLAFLIFHVLFLNTPPAGFLITLGSILIAAGFAVGGLIRSRLIKMALASAAVLGSIAGTWWIHTNLAASSLELTPLFRYDYTWPFARELLTALGVALAIGIPANLVDLSMEEGG